MTTLVESFTTLVEGFANLVEVLTNLAKSFTTLSAALMRLGQGITGFGNSVTSCEETSDGPSCVAIIYGIVVQAARLHHEARIFGQTLIRACFTPRV